MRALPVWQQIVVGVIFSVGLLLIFKPASGDQKLQYTITKDEALGPIKRTVEATLPARVDEATLTKIAVEIRDSNKKEFTRTLIGWRIEGEPPVPYWASARFDPDLKININGEPIAQ